ncbi:MAG: 4-hydroxy-tetrahydrodipicolinate synthase [Clostridia bacterium]|nr:4-hydroxy-tetrahydrodipicolinate synthase [Clostridia bacterium]
MKKRVIFEGVGTALATPFLQNEIDYPALFRMIDIQIDAGVQALIIGGTTGEAATLEDAEREQLYTKSAAYIDGRSRLILGTGTNDTKKAVAHARMAKRIGCDGILVVTPYYNKGTKEGIVNHYLQIADSSDLPILLYNVPGRTGVNLSLEQISSLAACEHIVGIKEASDSAERLVALSAVEDLALYAGNDSQFYTVLSLGGKGVISVASNLVPKRFTSLFKDFREGRREAALIEQKALLPLIEALFLETNPAPLKYALELSGLCTCEVRLPLSLPAEKTQERLRSLMK